MSRVRFFVQLAAILGIAVLTVALRRVSRTAEPVLAVPVPPASAVSESPPSSLASSEEAVQRFLIQQPARDPSMDPETYARAFQPPPRPSQMPPEARPKPSDITPSSRDWKQLQREGAVAY